MPASRAFHAVSDEWKKICAISDALPDRYTGDVRKFVLHAAFFAVFGLFFDKKKMFTIRVPYSQLLVLVDLNGELFFLRTV